MPHDVYNIEHRAKSILLSVFIVVATIFGSVSGLQAVTFINGFDVYTGDGAVNWTTVKNAGYQFAFVKATEGVNFIDSRFTTNMTGAHNAGVLVGPYHFTRLESKDGVAFTSYNGNPFPV